MNTFGTGDNTFRAEDEHFSAGGKCAENACSNFSHTHTATCSYMYQQLPNKTYVKLTFEDGHYSAAEINKVSRYTTTSSVTVNWSSRPSE